MANELLSLAYESVDPHKAERLRSCAVDPVFRKQEDGSLKLDGAWFCRVRLCPMCTWRRSLKVASQMRAIMDAIKQDKPYAYIMITLTQKNVTPDMLDSEITKVLNAFNLLTKSLEWKKAIAGYYRSMEVTHNLTNDTYHPHIHAVLAVNPSYFKNKDYITHDKWVSLWKRSMCLDYNPNVDVRRIKGDTAKAVAEVAKYSVKSEDYIIPDDWDMTVDTVRLLNDVLHNRRFISFGGIFKTYHKKLHLDDSDNGDLVHTDVNPVEQTNGNLIRFVWYSGYRQYVAEEL